MGILKQNIRMQHKNNLRIETMIYVLSIVLTFIILFYIYWAFFI